MARQIKIESGVLNIRMHPHSGEKYVDLLKFVYGRKNIVKLRGDRHAMISLLGSKPNQRVEMRTIF